MSTYDHKPVLLEQSGNLLLVAENGIYVDCTVGGGGHSEYFLQRLSPHSFLIGLDADPDAIKQSSLRLQEYPNVLLRQIYYDQIDVALVEADKYPVDGVFYDLGISSFQIDAPEKGFSFQVDAPLDMRFSPDVVRTAADILNRYDEEKLGALFRDYGEERHWRRIARAVAAARQIEPLTHSSQLVKIVQQAVGQRWLNKTLARIFQALRIEVNRELERLEHSLAAAFSMLKKGGRLVVISYHSLEDRIVKRFFVEKSKDCICPPEFPECVCDKVAELKILTRKPITPDQSEISRNPRARSAKLRAAEKLVDFEGVRG